MLRQDGAQTGGNRGGSGLPAGVKRVLILGASRSGIGAAMALAGSGREVLLSDRRPADELSGVAAVLDSGARLISEATLTTDWPQPDLIIKSPGIPAESPPVVLARERGVPVWSELELAYVLFANPIDAITGTNGKTTTTALLGHLFATAGRPAKVLGNIGVAVTSAAGTVNPDDELVVEVSSFQLEDIHTFRPACGVFLNLKPDHLDRHGTMERYLECKARLFANQGPDDIAVLNLSDPAVASLGRRLRERDDGPRVAYFSTRGAGCIGGQSPDSWVADDLIFLEKRPVVRIEEILMPGVHNLENCLAAGTAAITRGLEEEAVAEGLRTFRGVPHRLETAGIVAGVTYVNDSKATNVEATLTALNAYPANTHLILGGRDKASDYRPLARACAGRCKGVYLIGEAAPLIEAAFREVRDQEQVTGVPLTRNAGELENAVRMAAADAKPGDTVLLAPACASFDQYKDFEERGEHFRSIVAVLAGELQ